MNHLLLAMLGPCLIASVQGSGAAREESIGYQFTAGQTISYWIKIEWSEGDRTVGYLGTPMLQVKSISEKKYPEILVIGRLRKWERPKGKDTAHFSDGSDIWLATRLVLDKSGRNFSTKVDHNTEALPFNMKTYIKPTGMLLPGLPPTDGSRIGRSGSALLFEKHPQAGFNIGLLKTTKGMEQDWQEAKRLDSGLVQVRREVGFYTTEGPKMSWSYVGQTLFDPKQGLPLSLSATFTHIAAGETLPPVVIVARKLEGPEHDKAFAKSKEDWKLLPKSLNPIEFHRRPIDLFLPKHLKDASEAKPGERYGYQGEEHRHWLVRVVKAVDQQKVRIRFEGSDEEKEVNAALLVIIPEEKRPR